MTFNIKILLDYYLSRQNLKVNTDILLLFLTISSIEELVTSSYEIRIPFEEVIFLRVV